MSLYNVRTATPAKAMLEIQSNCFAFHSDSTMNSPLNTKVSGWGTHNMLSIWNVPHFFFSLVLSLTVNLVTRGKHA